MSHDTVKALTEERDAAIGQRDVAVKAYQNAVQTIETLREHHIRRLGISDPESDWGSIIAAAEQRGAEKMQLAIIARIGHCADWLDSEHLPEDRAVVARMFRSVRRMEPKRVLADVRRYHLDGSACLVDEAGCRRRHRSPT